MNKRIDEIRVPSIRFPSVYHDPSKLGFSTELNSLKYVNSITCVQAKIFIYFFLILNILLF